MIHFFLVTLFWGSFLSAEDKVIDWKICKQKELADATIPFNHEEKFNPDCAPEVIYTWRDQQFIAKIAEAQANGIGPVAQHPVKKMFFSKTPLSSHPYGQLAVRVKLKKDVKFIFAEGSQAIFPNRDCEYYKNRYPADYDKMVLVAYLSSYKFQEYILCSDGLIESWSYGTPEQLQEMEKELAYFKANPKAGAHENARPGYALVLPYEQSGQCADGNPCQQKDLDERFKHHREVAKTQGTIFYLTSDKSRESHFKTTKKFYYSLTTPNEMQNEMGEAVQ